ncbi:DUF559 domain-containing protein [Microbacterium sp. G2-8]|uniref:DUF559 domain-containing protein n=1 Tax=Microbacterium sp. G2-8 TaxID=2842454 RepID=UPI001C8A0797|nr:DUF559 domain-containing protein [Microbacterium sp. G2-8]
MPRRVELPDTLGDAFAVATAKAAGIRAGRLRSADLERPFHGVRARVRDAPALEDPFARARAETVRRARAYATRMRDDEFFAYETAVHLLGAPLPPAIGGDVRPLEVGVLGGAPLPRSSGVHGRRLTATMVHVVHADGLRASSPASTWAMLGSWSVVDLVALGDHLCRVRRAGVGRTDVGRPPLATREQLAAALHAGRRRGAARLREALELVRLDSWSPRESACRVHLIRAGLPEPELNIDLFDARGGHLGCVDLVYPQWKVAVEYQGAQHHATYAKDVERIERLRAEGWIIIQVTSALHADPAALVRRVAQALHARGWRG